MMDDQMREFVLGYVDGKIFTSANIPENQLETLLCVVFMPLKFGALKGISKKDRNNIGILWQWIARALPRGVNGFPIFTSAQLMSKADWERASKAIGKEQERRKSIEV